MIFAGACWTQLHDDFTLKELHAVLAASGLTDTSDATAARGRARHPAAGGIKLRSELCARTARFRSASFFRPRPARATASKTRASSASRTTTAASHYYATYTAYDGKITLPQLLETPDFVHFKFSTLNGPAVQNKGMALFPRKINGQYAMLSRQDDENILLMFSPNIHFWADPKVLLRPRNRGNSSSSATAVRRLKPKPAGWC